MKQTDEGISEYFGKLSKLYYSHLQFRKGNGECNMAVRGGEVASYKGGGECHILAKGW